MRLFYHPESDSLFLDEFDRDGLCDDVTDQPKMRVAAKLRGLDISKLDIGSHFQGNPTMASAVIESYRRWDRKPADLYPTPVNGTESVIPVIEAMADFAGGRRIWEPACGDGRMSRVLEWHGFNVFSSDLRETPGYGHGGVDFLVDHEKEYGWDPKSDIDMIVSNPPFKHAEAFIRKALSITPAVAMLLKQTYWNAASRLPFFAEHRPKLVLPLTFRLAFLESERGKSPLMDCCWVIWHEGDEDYCAFEPLPKRVYPGYHGPGLLSAMAALEEAMAGLTETVHGVVDQGGSASLLAGGGRGATTA